MVNILIMGLSSKSNIQAEMVAFNFAINTIKTNLKIEEGHSVITT